MKRRTVLTAAAAAGTAGLASLSQQAHGASGPRPADDGRSAAGRPARRLEVMSYNIHHCAGTDEVLSPARIARVIAASGADVVGLQEVDNHYGERSEWADQAALLARLTGFHAVFSANIDNDPPAPGRPRIQYGTAILSRHPILNWSNQRLTSSPGQEPRGLLRARINVRGVKLDVFNTHLAASSQVDRQAQATQVVAAMTRSRHAVLTGDLNAKPEAPEIATIVAALTDAWTAVGRGPGLTYPSEAPKSRIDYVFTNRNVRPLAAGVITTVPEASDHLPLLTRLSLL